MNSVVKVIGLFVFVCSMAGCNSNPSKQDIGTASGAVVGGVVGAVLTGGSTWGTVAGAAAGGVVGNKIGKDLEHRK